MMNTTDFSFEDLIAPVGLDEFLDRYWEKDRLCIRRTDGAPVAECFSMGDIDRWLDSIPEGVADSVVVVPSKGMADGSRRYETGEISKRALYQAFSEGSSIILNRVNLAWHPLSRITRMFGEIFHAAIGVNVYLTPEGSRAFPVHYDGHDVFILQVSGSKDWRLHEFNELPVSNYSYREHLKFPQYWSQPDKSPLLEELTLKRGDLLYIPRGMPHAAVSKEETSLHLTIGINPLYWMDFFKMAIEQTCFRIPVLRKALPPGFVARPDLEEDMEAVFRELVDDFCASVSFTEVLGVVRRERIQKQGYPGDGHFEDLLHLSDLSLRSMVERRANVLVAVETSEEYERVSLRFGEGLLRGPLRLRNTFEFIAQKKSFRVADLPEVDENGKLMLVRRLMRDGLLRFTADEGSTGGFGENVRTGTGTQKRHSPV